MEGVSSGQIGKAPAIICFAVPRTCTSVSQLNVSRFMELHDLEAQRSIQSGSRRRDSDVIRVCSLVCYRFGGAVPRRRFHVNVPTHLMDLVPAVCRRRGFAGSYQQRRREVS